MTGARGLVYCVKEVLVMSSPSNVPEWCNLCEHYHGALDACIETQEQEDDINIECGAVADFITLCLFVLMVVGIWALMSQ